MCVLILVEEFLGFCPCWSEDMEKLKDLSRKSYLEAWNISVFLKFIIINIYNGFFYPNFNQILRHFEAKVITTFLCFNQSDDDVTFEDENDDQLKSWM